MSTDMDSIKARIKKLMAYANDGAASDGEIENALAHAARLIDAHHLDSAEFAAAEKRDEHEMGRSWGKTESPKFHRWEITLSSAIEQLFGCVKVYLDGAKEPYRVNGIAQFYTGKYAGQRKMCSKVCFYGPVIEAQEAAELYQEWCASVAAMGVIRWGGAYKSHGAAYCEGFTSALYEKAAALNHARQLTQAKPLAQLPGVTTTAITLADRYTALQERASDWLKDTVKLKLGTGSGHSGTGHGGSDARREGRAHGNAAAFGRKAKHKALPG